jgi:tetratricopeptide (TPR) repeat protein
MIERLLILIITASIGLSMVVPSPQELAAYFKEGQGLFAIEDYRGAIQKFQRIVKTKSGLLDEEKVMVPVTLEEELNVPVQLAATYQLGNSHKKLGEFDQAVIHFEKVVQEAPLEQLRGLAQFQIISTRYEQQEYQKAVEEARELVEFFPQSQYVERALYNMGWAYYRLNQYPEAIEAFSEEIEKFPQGEYAARAQYQIAQSYYDGENYSQAIESYREVIDRYTPEEFSEQDWSKALLSRLRKRSQAEKSVLKGLEEQNLVELSAKAQLQIGECHVKLGQPKEAIEAYQGVTENFLPLTDLVELAYLKMAETALEADGLEASVKIYRNALENSSDRKFQAKMQYQIAKLYFQQEVYEQSALEYQIYIDGYTEEGPSIGFSAEDAQYAVGLSYFQAKMYQQSIEEYQKVLDQYPDSPLAAGSLYSIGLNHQMLKDLEQAEKAYQQVVDNYPEHDQTPLALLQLSRLYYEREEYQDAKNSYRRLLEDYSDSAQVEADVVLYELGLTCRDMGEAEEAASYLRRIEPSSKLFAGAVSEINEIFIKRGDFQQAEEELARALAKTEDQTVVAQIRYARARLYVAQQEYRRALDDFSYAIDHLEDQNLRNNALFGRGIIHYQFEEYQEAIPDLELLMTSQADPNLKKEARQKLGISYLKTGQKDRALALAQRLQESATDPAQKAESFLIIADLYYELQEFNLGVKSAGQALSLEGVQDELKVQAYYITGNCWSGIKNYAKALEAYSMALTRYPNSAYRADLLFQAGVMSYNLEDYEASAAKFESFGEEFGEHPNMVFALYYQAYSHFRRGLWQGARLIFSRLMSKYPNSEMVDEAHYQVAECFYNERQYHEALEAYRLILRDYSESRYAEDALYNVSWCQFQLEQEEEAVATLQEVVIRFPKGDYSADAQFTVGDYFYNKRDYARAEEAYQNVIDLFPESPRARQAGALIHELNQITSYLAYQEAVVLFDEKKYLAAIEAFQGIIEEYPGSDVVVGAWANIGASYEQLSRWDDALEIYNKLIVLYGDSPQHQDAVAFAMEHREWIEDTF